jgi:hypothetical protein
LEEEEEEFDPFSMEDKELKKFMALGNTTCGTRST